MCTNKVHHTAVLRARHDCLQRLSLHPTVAMSALVAPLQHHSEWPVRRVGRVTAREGPGGPVRPGSTGHQSNLPGGGPVSTFMQHAQYFLQNDVPWDRLSAADIGIANPAVGAGHQHL